MSKIWDTKWGETIQTVNYCTYIKLFYIEWILIEFDVKDYENCIGQHKYR